MVSALARLGGNRVLLATLLDRFVFDFETLPAQLLAAIDAGEPQRAALLAHKVRGAAGNLSMPELFSAAVELEQLLVTPRGSAVEAALAAFGAALERVLDGVHALDRAALLQIATVSP